MSTEGWVIRGSCQLLRQEVDRPGTVCVIHEPRAGCGPEQVSTSTRLSGGRASVQRAFWFGNWIRLGEMVLLSATFRPAKSFPLALVGSLANHWIAFKACATNPNTYDPYCETSPFRELGFGVVLLLR